MADETFTGARAQVLNWLVGDDPEGRTEALVELEQIFSSRSSEDQITVTQKRGATCTGMRNGVMWVGEMRQRCWTNPGEEEMCTPWRCVLLHPLNDPDNS